MSVVLAIEAVVRYFGSVMYLFAFAMWSFWSLETL